MTLKKLSQLIPSLSTIFLVSISTCYAGAGGGCGTGSVSLPEPGSLGLLAAGVGAVLLYRWRRKSK